LKSSLLSFVLIFACFTNGYTQTSKFDFSLFRLNGLGFISDKQAIVKQFGEPDKVVEPDYECGFHSEREQDRKFYELCYGPITFIGNDTDKYMIEIVEFSPYSNTVLEYGNYKLSGKTSTNAFKKIFGEAVLNDPLEYSGDEIGVTLFPDRADQGVTFFFKDEYLVRISHYSPC
jgi:hypothetical protein